MVRFSRCLDLNLHARAPWFPNLAKLSDTECFLQAALDQGSERQLGVDSGKRVTRLKGF